jgi:predicted permease
VVLLVGTALFVESLGNVNALRLGFDPQEVAYARILPQRAHLVEDPAVLREVAARIATIPGISGVALSSHPPLMGSTVTGVFVENRDGETVSGPSPRGTYNSVSPEFFGAAGVRIVEGRGFAAGEETGVVVVDETMARLYWPGQPALGKCLFIGRTPEGPCQTVVGVAEDQRDRTVIEDPTPKYLRPLGPDDLLRTVVMRVDPRSWPEVSAAVRGLMADHIDAQAFQIDRMSSFLEPQYRPWRLGARLFGVFGLLALIVTAVGVYGVTAYAVSERTHEMGVRVALGAKMSDLLRLVLGEGFRVVLLGCLLGIATTLALGRMLASLLFEVTPRDPSAALAASAVLIVAGVAASLVPALRAGRVDPSEVLRQD